MTETSSKDLPGVIAPPPLIYLAGFGIGFGLDRLRPIPLLPPSITHVVALGLLVVGCVAFAGVYAFVRARTSPSPWTPVSALVTTGIYRYSRNPMYLGFTALYLAATAWRNTAWTLPLLVVVLVVMQWGVIGREEEYLERRFGEDYRLYKSEVRRWL